MAVVYSNDLGLKKLFGEETKQEACAAAAKQSGKKESATSKVLYEGSPSLCPCLCYAEDELAKEHEGLYRAYFKAVLPRMFKFWASQSRYNNEGLPKMFNEWATIHGKRYYSLYEWRLRFKIWCSAKKMIEQRCLKSGRMFSIDRMKSSADKTVIERSKLHVFKPDESPLIEIATKISVLMGESWMYNAMKEFQKWAERHERVYSSNKERDKRLVAYMENLRRIDLEEIRYPGSWKYGKDLENMDKFDWEASLIPPVTCNCCKASKMVAPVLMGVCSA